MWGCWMLPLKEAQKSIKSDTHFPTEESEVPRGELGMTMAHSKPLSQVFVDLLCDLQGRAQFTPLLLQGESQQGRCGSGLADIL